MGKVGDNSEVEIIPINEENSNTSPPNNQSNSDDQQRVNMQKIPYMSDPTIIPRVQKYLESNVHRTYVDINAMADELQSKYREYSKRKRSAFRAAVKKAYSVVLRSYGMPDEDQSTTDDEESQDWLKEYEKSAQNDSMNDQLLDLYRRPMPKQIDENELIDISSDDSEAEQPATNNKPNGPSTSVASNPRSFVQNQQNNIHNRPVSPAVLSTISAPQSNERGKKRKADSAGGAPTGVPKKKKSLATLQEPGVTFKDLGGMDKVLEEVCKLLIHVRHPEVYRQIGITPPRGFLLHGPPGCGKTLLAKAIAGELSVPLLKVAAPELVAGVSGESEERIRELFERAAATTPCVLFIDEIDAITPNRQNAQKEMERRIVAQLLTCLDDLSQNEENDRVLVIGATNRPDALDPALRRAGRFDREICLGIPDVRARVQILKVLTSKLKLAEDFDFETLGKYTPGFVGADLLSLTREAAMAAVNRTFSLLKERKKIEQQLAIEKQHLQRKKELEKEREEEKEAGDANKSDPEIIVDDVEPVKANSNEASPAGSPTNETNIVVIEDEINKQNSQSSSVSTHLSPGFIAGLSEDLLAQINGEPEPMPVDVKQLTPLEELMAWLHDKVALTGEQLQSLCITAEDFGKALKCVQPSAKREGFATVPDVTWDDVGSLKDVREELQMAILAPVRHSEQFEALGLSMPSGVLLCGPPGCGKTLLAKAVANEAGINFISVKGPELLNMYVGESERAVRVCFERARNSAPCVIFFDELDALCPKRSDSREGGATMRVVNQMLTEMDGVEGRRGVFILAASNRPDIIDPAVLRPGRLDKILFVGLPTASDRADILHAITKNGTQPRLSPDVDLQMIGKSQQCNGYTGADLAALVREAGFVALKDFMVLGTSEQPLMVSTDHFNRAVAKIRPSVPEKDQKHYEKLRRMYTAIPEQSEVEEMEYS